MKKIQTTKLPGIPPLSMEEEFLCHNNGFEWWFTTRIALPWQRSHASSSYCGNPFLRIYRAAGLILLRERSPSLVYNEFVE